MDSERYLSGLIMVYATAECLLNSEDLPLAEMLHAIDHADTVGPIVDPTLWMKCQARMATDKRVVEILARAQRELNALPWPKRTGDPVMESGRV